jgi:hypothetical protein
MIEAEDGQLTIGGDHLRALYTLLRTNEDGLGPRLAEVHTAVQRVLFESLSIDEIERLNDDPEDY